MNTFQGLSLTLAHVFGSSLLLIVALGTTGILGLVIFCYADGVATRQMHQITLANRWTTSSVTEYTQYTLPHIRLL